jgi:anti-sigma B factor antagonist
MSEKLTINTSVLKRVCLIEADGRVDSTTADVLGNALNQAIEDGKRQLVLDLSKVEYMSSAGLREMVSALKRVKGPTGGDLRLASPSERVKEVLDLAGLDEIFEIYDTQVEAVGSF